jgi:PAS domain S-box-containing protein
MLRRTQIVLAITIMVAALVSTFSYLYISQILRTQVASVWQTASNLTAQLGDLANGAVPDLSSTRVNLNKPEAVKSKIADYLGTDRDLNDILTSVVSTWPAIYDASIEDQNGQAILHTNGHLVGKKLVPRPDFQMVVSAGFKRQLRMIYNPPEIYEVSMPLQLNGAPFGSVRVGISTLYLRTELTPRLQHALALSVFSILLSILLAAGLSQLALGPLERISRTLDSVTAGEGEEIEPAEPGKDEYGLVTLKIAHLGRQMRDAKEIFSALKDNVDQIMANLQDGLMLFTGDSRVVLVSASVERFLGRPRQELLGRTVREIFTNSSHLGAMLLDAFQRKHPLEPQEIDAPNGKRMQVSLDFIQERGSSIGALLTLRDAESARRIEDEIEMSRRMSASGRLTRGVAHEVKNPINAIVLHLQLLQTKMQQVDPDTQRHVQIIDSEIRRLDRVVQILVDFTRPRDLKMEDLDLHRLLDEVVLLAGLDAEQHKVEIVRELPPDPLPVRADADLMKQAILNVVINGIQAMPLGGKLTVAAVRDENNITVEISDQGGGIPPEAQEKIFELYFTTKKGGSGIGLAQTYQILQWHYGSVDFSTEAGKGTTFRLRLPEAEVKAENGFGNPIAAAEPRV